MSKNMYLLLDAYGKKKRENSTLRHSKAGVLLCGYLDKDWYE